MHCRYNVPSCAFFKMVTVHKYMFVAIMLRFVAWQFSRKASEIRLYADVISIISLRHLHIFSAHSCQKVQSVCSITLKPNCNERFTHAVSRSQPANLWLGGSLNFVLRMQNTVRRILYSVAIYTDQPARNSGTGLNVNRARYFDMNHDSAQCDHGPHTWE